MHLLTVLLSSLQVDEDLGMLRIDLDGQLVTIDHMTDTVSCDNDVLRQRVDKARVRMLQAMRPCSFE